MTDRLHTPPPPTAAAHHERPFPRDPRRWEKKRSRALRTGHVRDHTCSAACEPVLVHERTLWGWLAWAVPGDGTLPEIPHQIGVLTPAATRTQRLALRWLTRRPAERLALGTLPGSLRLATAAIALIRLIACLFAIRHKVPLELALPAMLLAPLVAEHPPERLDAWTREHVRMVEGDVACRCLQRLAVLHASLVRASVGSDRDQLRRSAEIGHNLLFDAAGLLQSRDTRTVSAGLIARERLMLQLAHQVAQILKCTPQDGTADAHHASAPGRPPGPYLPCLRPTTQPLARHAPTDPPLQKGTLPMTQPEPAQAVPALGVYLLFAHEPYYPAAAQEINTTVVAVASLLHPRVRQPDGARIHDRLVQGRRSGEIVPLSTLTHELDAGARWPEVGDWEAATEDLLQLVRDHDCDALNLDLPDIARALVCSGPHSQVRVVDPTSGAHLAYGPADRIEVLVEVGRHLAWAEAGSPLWPGDGLLSPINSGDAS
ncbi:hypothetical protein STRCI_008628 [Streptomyces cinnabarinus]|uniref:Uncharacterized protein n=1 Tax=Streptomyces cinnabarinus TaxID=67287 RepID=A0ABY7KQU2_9ACTN|nr:hypothetical protein [Streptomyces cinnabarinus]WAZ26942.1 hypothetical protein STRCI_008628 [Streptomyces cinnabarinus]